MTAKTLAHIQFYVQIKTRNGIYYPTFSQAFTNLFRITQDLNLFRITQAPINDSTTK